MSSNACAVDPGTGSESYLASVQPQSEARGGSKTAALTGYATGRGGASREAQMSKGTINSVSTHPEINMVSLASS